MKRCCTCKESLPLSHFYSNKNYVHGHSYACKDCTRTYMQKKAQKISILGTKHKIDKYIKYLENAGYSIVKLTK